MLLQLFEARDSPDRDDIHAFDRRTKSHDKREAASADAATVIASHMSRALMSAVDHTPEFDLDDLVERLVAVFRRHPHVSNVKTHISGARWGRIAQALRAILGPAGIREDLSPLAQNIVELMWAERGVAGRILKPYLHEQFVSILPRPVADHLLGQIAGLCGAPQAGIAHRGLAPSNAALVQSH
ncbi:hypothetical protein [Mesorhizobium sp. 2RAF21]|uniref:hypothetical protein n=1 Tax=Mesorhizobium sp. 2RAF21 TaxID=3232995 RepID=UPI003F96FD56